MIWVEVEVRVFEECLKGTFLPDFPELEGASDLKCTDHQQLQGKVGWFRYLGTRYPEN